MEKFSSFQKNVKILRLIVKLTGFEKFFEIRKFQSNRKLGVFRKIGELFEGSKTVVYEENKRVTYRFQPFSDSIVSEVEAEQVKAQGVREVRAASQSQFNKH